LLIMNIEIISAATIAIEIIILFVILH